MVLSQREIIVRKEVEGIVKSPGAVLFVFVSTGCRQGAGTKLSVRYLETAGICGISSILLLEGIFSRQAPTRCRLEDGAQRNTGSVGSAERGRLIEAAVERSVDDHIFLFANQFARHHSFRIPVHHTHRIYIAEDAHNGGTALGSINHIGLNRAPGIQVCRDESIDGFARKSILFACHRTVFEAPVSAEAIAHIPRGARNAEIVVVQHPGFKGVAVNIPFLEEIYRPVLILIDAVRIYTLELFALAVSSEKLTPARYFAVAGEILGAETCFLISIQVVIHRCKLRPGNAVLESEIEAVLHHGPLLLTGTLGSHQNHTGSRKTRKTLQIMINL